MAYLRDATLQKTLEDIANNCNYIFICSDNPGPPTDLSNSLGNAALTLGDGNGSYTIADGTTSGRKLTLAATNIPATASGTGKWYVLSNGTTIYHADTIADKDMVSGSTYEFPATDILEIHDPA